MNNWQASQYATLSLHEEMAEDAEARAEMEAHNAMANFRAACSTALEAAKALTEEGIAELTYPDGTGEEIETVIQSLQLFTEAKS